MRVDFHAENTRPRRPMAVKFLLVLWLLAPPLRSVTEPAGGEWEFLYQHQDIKVYRNHEQPPTFKAEGVLPVDMFQALAVLADFERRPEWLASLSEIRLVEGDPESTAVLYSVFALPWPFKDRDSVVAGTADVDYESREVVITFRRTTHPSYPERKDRIRIPVVEGRYFLRYDDEGRMFATYEIKMDSGGFLPRWLSSRFIKKAPMKTLAAFRAQIVKTRGEYDDFVDRHRRRAAEYQGGEDADQ